MGALSTCDCRALGWGLQRAKGLGIRAVLFEASKEVSLEGKRLVARVPGSLGDCRAQGLRHH